MEIWENRPKVIAHLFNPCFCGEILHIAIKSYNKVDNKSGFPFPLYPLVLPILLHKSTRDALPLKSNSNMNLWTISNQHLLIDFPNRVINLKPFSEEAISFLMAQNMILINDLGMMETVNIEKGKKKKKIIYTEEVNTIFSKAEFIGKWFHSSGSTQNIYMYFGIKP